jgi:photosystem II stability/assembly factor-like uncharacterized protein
MHIMTSRVAACIIVACAVIGAVSGAREARAASSTLAATRPAIASLDAVDFVDAQHGWVAGAGILATRDGGLTWTAQPSPAASISALDFVNAQDGWALGTTAAQTAVLLRTTDGGRHWAIAHEPAGLAFQLVLLRVRFVSPTRGVGVAAPDVQAGGGWIVTTSDGGETWHPVVTPGDVTSACATPSRGGPGKLTDLWAVALQGDTVWRTTDGGHTWAAALTAGPAYQYGGQIACISPSNVWVTLDGGYGMSQHSYALYHTADAGAHWRVVVAQLTAGAGPAPGTALDIPGPGIYTEVMDALDGTTAFLASGCPACGAGTTAVGRATDGGRTWHNYPPIPGIGYDVRLAISFPTASRGWLVSTTSGARQVGLIVATADGGRTWTRQ